MRILEISQPENERQQHDRQALHRHLEDHRDLAIEILKERFLDALYRATTDELAARVVSQSSTKEVNDLCWSIFSEASEEQMNEEANRSFERGR